tara:strand:- start:344 stop:475 length:132 start_codon:yes stop_codon:yes gene_type:complete
MFNFRGTIILGRCFTPTVWLLNQAENDGKLKILWIFRKILDKS